jgi:hypothetical protein
MAAEMVIRIPDYRQRKKELQYSYEEYEYFGIPRDYIQAAARWRQVVEYERSRSSMHGIDEGWWDGYDGEHEGSSGEAEPDPTSAFGRCAGHELRSWSRSPRERAQTGQWSGL